MEQRLFEDVGEMRDGEFWLELVARYPADPLRDRAPTYDFAMCQEGTASLVGTIRLRIGHSEDLEMYAGHIGYGVAPAYRGRHYAERACRLLLPLAARHGFTEIWITCNPDNIPSRRTCERLGAELVEIVDLPPTNEMYLRGERQKCRYRVRMRDEG